MAASSLKNAQRNIHSTQRPVTELSSSWRPWISPCQFKASLGWCKKVIHSHGLALQCSPAPSLRLQGEAAVFLSAEWLTSLARFNKGLCISPIDWRNYCYYIQTEFSCFTFWENKRSQKVAYTSERVLLWSDPWKHKVVLCCSVFTAMVIKSHRCSLDSSTVHLSAVTKACCNSNLFCRCNK